MAEKIERVFGKGITPVDVFAAFDQARADLAQSELLTPGPEATALRDKATQDIIAQVRYLSSLVLVWDPATNGNFSREMVAEVDREMTVAALTMHQNGGPGQTPTSY